MEALQILRMGVTLVIFVAYCFILIEFRFPLRRALLRLGLWMAGVAVLNALILLGSGYDAVLRYMPLTLLLPITLGIFYVSRHRGFRLLFSGLTVCFFAMLVVVAGTLAALPFGRSIAVDFVARLAAAAFIAYFFLKSFRQAFLRVLGGLCRGWAALCLVPLLFFLQFYFLTCYPVPLHDRPQNVLPTVLLFMLTLATYFIIYRLFDYLYQLFDMQHNDALLRAQVQTLESQQIQLRQEGENVRILRHDMRHHLRTLAAYLHERQYGEALAYLESLGGRLEATAVQRYCENEAANSVLSFWLAQARGEGIAVRGNLVVPKDLWVDSIEFSVVLANAVENALQACRGIPAGGERRIALSGSLSRRNLILEIANTTPGGVWIGRDGLPVSARTGHGIGTRSIAAFAKKHGAQLQYLLEDGLFKFRLVLPRTAPAGEGAAEPGAVSRTG